MSENTEQTKPVKLIHCANCRTLVKENEVHYAKISNYRQYGPGGKVFPFCSGRCAVEYQMGAEG